MKSEFDIQGHRGARGLLPENTLPAFRKALDLGVTTLEMDVVISADDQVVVSHEPWMSAEICTKPDGAPVTREEEHSLRIYSMPYEAVARFDCGLRRPVRFPHQESVAASKPLLRDVIQMAEGVVQESGRPAINYNIETKSRPRWDGKLHPDPARFTELLCSVLQDHNVLERSTIQSFDLRTLREARRMEPQWCTSLLVGKVLARFLGLNLRRLGFVPDVYSPHHGALTRRLVKRVHRHGMALIPWTINTEDHILAAVGLGVDGIITDYPDRARSVLERLLGS